MTKATLDAIQLATGINDNKYVKVNAEKQISPNTYESLLIVMVGYEPEPKVRIRQRRTTTPARPPLVRPGIRQAVPKGSPDKESTRIGKNGAGTKHHPVDH